MSINLPPIAFQVPLPPLTWNNSTDLGVIRADNNAELRVTATDNEPESGVVSYAVVPGHTLLTSPPQYLKLDTDTGHLYGYVPYQPAVSQTYSITIAATKLFPDNTRFVTTNTFSLVVKGDVDTTLVWETDPDLGSLYTSDVSELSVLARQLNSDYSIKYSVSAGALPAGLTLNHDGTISGRVNTGAAGSYTITIMASDVYTLSSIYQTFTLSVLARQDQSNYTDIYVKPFLSRDKRDYYSGFTNDEHIFDPALIYRPMDANFGVRHQIEMTMEFGIELLDLGQYAQALRHSFYRKRLYFGDVKTAKAVDSMTGDTIYDVVYVDVVDDQVNNSGISVSSVVSINNVAYYPASIDNMRLALSQIILPDQSEIMINPDSLPKFMQSPQITQYSIPMGYVRAIPLCYAKPDQGSKIASRIKSSGFEFNRICFEIDRIIVRNSLDNPGEHYLLFGKNAITD